VFIYVKNFNCTLWGARLGWVDGIGDAVEFEGHVRLSCLDGRPVEASPWRFLCPGGGLLDVEVEPARPPSWGLWASRRPGVWRYRELLPAPRGVEPVTLGEGGTPLVPLERVSGEVGARVYGKLEGSNPTGSFKDRGMTVAVTLARSAGARVVLVASTGNTAASAAAYAARAGLEAVVLVPRGAVARGKLAQALLHGAVLVEVEGSFDDALAAVIEAVESGSGLYPLNSFNPWRLEGRKTAAFEVAEALGGRAPDWVVVPVGNAGNIYAIWKGFKELRRHGLIDSLPRMAGVQAAGAAPLARAWELGLEEPVPVERPETVASAIRIGRPVNAPKALRAVRESGGVMTMVSDEEILRAQADLARLEGIAVEPASAAALAGLRRLAREGVVERGETVVLILTGHGLKDPDAAALHPARRLTVTADKAVDAILSIAGSAGLRGARSFQRR